MESFGFKHGLPLDADIVMDVRFLPNPHWDEALRPLTGHDPQVRDYVLETSSGSDFIDRFESLLVSLLPQYESEGRSYLTVATGCTGGRHRVISFRFCRAPTRRGGQEFQLLPNGSRSPWTHGRRLSVGLLAPETVLHEKLC